MAYYHDTITILSDFLNNDPQIWLRVERMSFEQTAGSSCLYNVFDLIYLNVVCLLAIKMTIIHLIIINLKPYFNAWYTYQYLSPKGA